MLGNLFIYLLVVSLNYIVNYSWENIDAFSFPPPQLQIRNGKQSCYTLKNKDLEHASKGVIYLELDVLFNPVS